MVTAKNSAHRHNASSGGEVDLLLDRFILVLKKAEHVPSTHGDILKYVHEKSRCYNICGKGAGIKRAGYKEALEAELMVTNEIVQGGKLFGY
jgi:hypothetical protein